MEKGYHCWVTNRTRNKVTIADLRVTLQPNATIDLLDERHSRLSVETVVKSIESGSLKERHDTKKIFIRQIEPKNTPKTNTLELSNVSFPNKHRTGVIVEERRYEELEINFNEYEFAEQNADAAIAEHQPKINFNKHSNNEEYDVEE